MTFSAKRVFLKDVTAKMRSLRWALMQYVRCPNENRQTQNTGGHMKTEAGIGVMQIAAKTSRKANKQKQNNSKNKVYHKLPRQGRILCREF